MSDFVEIVTECVEEDSNEEVKFIYVPVVPKFILKPARNIKFDIEFVPKVGKLYPAGLANTCVILLLLAVTLSTKLPDETTDNKYIIYM